jgi:hypothetical protein
VRLIDKHLTSYLKQVAEFMPKRPGNEYSGFEDFYLRRGRLFSHAPYTVAETKAILLKLSGERDVPKRGQCFLNAQRLAAHGAFGYAEGYTFHEGLPIAIHHAWAVHNGKPVDVTIREDGDRDTRDPVKLLERASRNLARGAYYGVSFPRASFMRIWHTEGIARAVVEDWKGRFPLLRGAR